MKNLPKKEVSQPIYKIREEKNVYVEMRDGVRLACDIYRPDAEGKFPALLSMCPYTKELESLKIPPKPFNQEYATIEGGNTEFFVSRGYVHVIVDIRGTGHSEGRYDICSTKEQEDGYDFVEWLAQQPWCDGNVGMVWTNFYLRANSLLEESPPTTEETPDGFNHKPVLPLMAARFPLDPMPEYLTYTTKALNQDTEVIKVQLPCTYMPL